MSYKMYQRLMREWRRKQRSYPDRGWSIRPWEDSLRSRIAACIKDGLERGCAWAQKAARDWHLDER